MREKNIRHAEKGKRVSFIPKCDRGSGAWLPEQCLEELGVCWCVTQTGEQVPGSLTRGAPQCLGSARGARRMEFDPSTPTNMICEPGQSVHVCDKALCEGQVCFSHPRAVCRVNPCGGCSPEFVDEFNSPVNCEVGLGECHRDLQRVINSPMFAKAAAAGRPFPPPPPHSTQVHYDVDLFRNVDVYYSPSPSTPSTPQRQGRTLGDTQEDLRVSGDVVKEATEHQRNRRNTQGVRVSPLVEKSLVDPEEVRGRMLSGAEGHSFDIHFPHALTLDDTFEAVPSEETPTSSQGMTLQPPACDRDGTYTPEQRSGALSWCVDAKGHPRHDTLTRGTVKCGYNGELVEQVSGGPVCPGGGVAPRVCRGECLRAACHSHPDAVCVADPCNDCRVAFYNPRGERVHCEDRCSQPLAKGMCRASFKRYFYNTTSLACEEFIFGGCRGNDNNFGTVEECQQECQSADICVQPVSAGSCSGVGGEARWYYNTETRKCEPFLYSGCGGNGNNFRSKSQCEARCPDLVLCPYWSAASMEPQPCSRSAACRNHTCHGHPEAICRADPCTCSPTFVDHLERPLTCLTPTLPPKTRITFTFEEDTSTTRKQNQNTNHEQGTTEGEEEGDQDGVTIYLEGEPSLTRCQLLRRHLQERNALKYVAQCDEEGRFVPTQCYAPRITSEGDIDDPKCWCVDETGHKTQPTVYFTKGQRECDVVAVESVVVTLGFRGREAGMKHLGKVKGKEIKDQVNTLLKQMTAETLENDVGVFDLPDLTQVKFTLLGKNKIDVAYQLEEKVKKGELALELNEERLPADLRSSWFHHQVSEPVWHSEGRLGEGGGSGREGEVVSAAVMSAGPPYLAATLVLTVVCAMLVCGLVVAVVLYRRQNTTGHYPKDPRGSLHSLGFSDTSSLDRLKHAHKHTHTPPPPPPPPCRPTITTIENEYRMGRH